MNVNTEIYEALLSIGSQMSNVCFNLAQRSETLTDHDRENLRKLYNQWDAERQHVNNFLAIRRNIAQNKRMADKPGKSGTTTKKPAAKHAPAATKNEKKKIMPGATAGAGRAGKQTGTATKKRGRPPIAK